MTVTFEKAGKKIKVWREGTVMKLEVEGVEAICEAVKVKGKWGFRVSEKIMNVFGRKGNGVMTDSVAEHFAREVKDAMKNVNVSKISKDAKRSFLQHDIDKERKAEYTDKY